MHKIIPSVLATAFLLTAVGSQAESLSKDECKSAIEQTRGHFKTLKQQVEDSYASNHITEQRYRHMTKQLKDAKEKLTEASCLSVKTDKDRAKFRCLNENNGNIDKCIRKKG